MLRVTWPRVSATHVSVIPASPPPSPRTSARSPTPGHPLSTNNASQWLDEDCRTHQTKSPLLNGAWKHLFAQTPRSHLFVCFFVWMFGLIHSFRFLAFLLVYIISCTKYTYQYSMPICRLQPAIPAVFCIIYIYLLKIRTRRSKAHYRITKIHLSITTYL